MSTLLMKPIVVASALLFALFTHPACAVNYNIILKSGDYEPVIQRGIYPLCNQTISILLDDEVVIDYQQPCSLAETVLECNSVGYCVGEVSDEKIYIQVYKNNYYTWGNLTKDFGGSFLHVDGD